MPIPTDTAPRKTAPRETAPRSWLERHALPLAFVLALAGLGLGGWFAMRHQGSPVDADTADAVVRAAVAGPFVPNPDPALKAAFTKEIWELQQLANDDPARLDRACGLARRARALDAAAVADSYAELVRTPVSDAVRQALRLEAVDLLVGQHQVPAAFKFLHVQATAAETLHHQLKQAIELRRHADALTALRGAEAITAADRCDNRKRLAGALLESGDAPGALAALPSLAECTAANEAAESTWIWRSVILIHQPGDRAAALVAATPPHAARLRDDVALLSKPWSALAQLARGYVLAQAGDVAGAAFHRQRGLALMQISARAPATLAERIAANDIDREPLDAAFLIPRLESSRSGIHQTDAVKRRVYDWAKAELAQPAGRR